MKSKNVYLKLLGLASKMKWRFECFNFEHSADAFQKAVTIWPHQGVAILIKEHVFAGEHPLCGS